MLAFQVTVLHYYKMSVLRQPSEIITEQVTEGSFGMRAQLEGIKAGVEIFAAHVDIPAQERPVETAELSDYLRFQEQTLARDFRLAAFYHRWRTAIHLDGFNRLFGVLDPDVQNETYMQAAEGLAYIGPLPPALEHATVQTALEDIMGKRKNRKTYFLPWDVPVGGEFGKDPKEHLVSRGLEILQGAPPEILVIYPDLGVRLSPITALPLSTRPDEWMLSVKAFPRSGYNHLPTLPADYGTLAR